MDKIVETALVNALRFGVFTRVQTLDAALAGASPPQRGQAS